MSAAKEYDAMVDNACASMARMMKDNTDFLVGVKELVCPVNVSDDNVIILRASWVKKPVSK